MSICNVGNFPFWFRGQDLGSDCTSSGHCFPCNYLPLIKPHCSRQVLNNIQFSSPEPLGSQGELIVYPSSRRPSVGVRRRRRRSQWSKIFFSETAGPIKAKFYVEPPWVGGMIFCSRHLGHMTKMAATPIYGKNPSKIFFSRTGEPIFTKLGM